MAFGFSFERKSCRSRVNGNKLPKEDFGERELKLWKRQESDIIRGSEFTII